MRSVIVLLTIKDSPNVIPEGDFSTHVILNLSPKEDYSFEKAAFRLTVLLIPLSHGGTEKEELLPTLLLGAICAHT